MNMGEDLSFLVKETSRPLASPLGKREAILQRFYLDVHRRWLIMVNLLIELPLGDFVHITWPIH